MMDEVKDCYPRVNGGISKQYSRQKVSILGQVKKVHADMRTFDLKASDGVMITVRLNQNLEDHLENTMVEVCGTVNDCKLLAESYVLFPTEMTNDFSMELYDQAVTISHNSGNPYKD